MKNEKLQKLIYDVLEKGYLMSLGVYDNGGVWVSDVIFVFDENFHIFWMSDPDTRHSKAIEENPKVSGTITVSGQGQLNLGIQFSGIAQKIDGPRFDLAKKHYTKRKKPEPKEFDDVLQGDSWYELSPAFIELIHEELFGFEKQKTEL